MWPIPFRRTYVGPTWPPDSGETNSQSYCPKPTRIPRTRSYPKSASAWNKPSRCAVGQSLSASGWSPLKSLFKPPKRWSTKPMSSCMRSNARARTPPSGSPFEVLKLPEAISLATRRAGRVRVCRLGIDAEHHKSAGPHFPSAFARRRWIEISSRQEEGMCFQIERHSPRRFPGRNRVYNTELVAGIFVSDGDMAVTCRGKRQVGFRVETVGVNPLPDWHRRDHFSRVWVDHRHHSVATPGEKAPTLPVGCQARRFFARRDRPAMTHGKLLSIELDELGLILDIHEDGALSIGHREFRFAAKSDGA